MKKLVKLVLCLALIAVAVFAPVGAKEGPGPDDRPIGWISINSVGSPVRF